MNPRRPSALFLLLAALAVLAGCETPNSSATPGDFLKWGLEQGLRNACASARSCSNRSPDAP